MPESLEAVSDGVRRRLTAAVAARHDPLRTPVLATTGADGPAGRTVVLCAVTEDLRSLQIYTDARSDKIAELAAESRVGLIFYDPENGIQVRLSGTAVVHRNNDVSNSAWSTLPAPARREYLSVAVPGSGLAPADGDLDEETARTTAFAVIEITAERLDWLRLDPTGHRRARFDHDGGAWRGQWVVP